MWAGRWLFVEAQGGGGGTWRGGKAGVGGAEKGGGMGCGGAGQGLPCTLGAQEGYMEWARGCGTALVGAWGNREEPVWEVRGGWVKKRAAHGCMAFDSDSSTAPGLAVAPGIQTPHPTSWRCQRAAHGPGEGRRRRRSWSPGGKLGYQLAIRASTARWWGRANTILARCPMLCSHTHGKTSLSTARPGPETQAGRELRDTWLTTPVTPLNDHFPFSKVQTRLQKWLVRSH